MHYVEDSFKTWITGAADIPAGSAVKLVANKIVLATAATDVILGVIEVAAKIGKPIDVHLRSAAGTATIKLGGTVAAQAAVTANGSGVGITTTTAGDQIIGYALEGGTTGKFIEIMPSTAKY